MISLFRGILSKALDLGLHGIEEGQSSYPRTALVSRKVGVCSVGMGGECCIGELPS